MTVHPERAMTKRRFYLPSRHSAQLPERKVNPDQQLLNRGLAL